MGCVNSKVETSENSHANRKKARNGNFLMRGVYNVFFRRNRVVPGTAPTTTTSGSYDSDDDLEQPSTSCRERSHDVLFRRRFFAANPQISDDSDDSSEGEMTSPLNKEDEHDKGYDILVIDHCDTEEEREDSDHMSIINVKERLGGVAFELMDDDETTACLPEKSSVFPVARMNDTRSSKGGVAFDIDFTDHADDAAEKSSVCPMARMNDTRSSKGGVAFDIDFTDNAAEKSSVYPMARMNDTRSSKGGLAFDIDFTDDAAEKRTLTTISKVTSIMARDGWSERDVIKEADDVWVANKVLAVKDNARRSQERLAAREKAELDFDMITATMTDDDVQDFYFIGMKETSTERSLLRQTYYRAWLAKLRA